MKKQKDTLDYQKAYAKKTNAYGRLLKKTVILQH